MNPSAGKSPAAAGYARFTIDVPKTVNAGTARAPHFISPNTQSVSITVNGANRLVANLTPSSPGCTPPSESNPNLSCTINVTAPIATDTFVVKLYDQENGNGHVLASTTVVKQIASSTPITIEMNGVASSIVVFLSNPAPLIGQSSQLQVGVTAMDASGAVIMGPGNFSSPVTLSSDDRSGHTSLSGTSIAGPSSTVALTYDGSASITTVTISATSPGVTATTPAVLRPANAQNGGGGVAVVHVGADTYAEVPSSAGLIQVKLTDNGTLATTPPSPGPSPSARGTLLAIPNGVDSCAIASVNARIDAFCVNLLTADTPIDIIDLTAGTPSVTGSITTDASSKLTFSGGSCYLCGITWDPLDNAILVSTGNNAVRESAYPGSFEFYKIDGTQARASIPVANLTENFAYNSTTNQIFNFGYDEADLVDVASGVVYRSADPLFTKPNDGYPGPGLDSSAVDAATNLDVAVSEHGDQEFFAPMNAAVLAGETQTGTFTNPLLSAAYLTISAVSSGDAECEPTAISIDSVSHLAFISGEYSVPNCVSVIQLPATPPNTAVQPTSYMSIPQMPNTPDGLIFDSAWDPHVAATFYLSGTDVFGLIFNSARSWVAVVDLTKLLAAPPSELDPHLVDPAYDLIGNGILTYLPTGFHPGAASKARARTIESRRHR